MPGLAALRGMIAGKKLLQRGIGGVAAPTTIESAPALGLCLAKYHPPKLLL